MWLGFQVFSSQHAPAPRQPNALPSQEEKIKAMSMRSVKKNPRRNAEGQQTKKEMRKTIDLVYGIGTDINFLLQKCRLFYRAVLVFFHRR